MAAWNALFIISGLFLIALAGEAYFRLTRPFIETSALFQFMDGVGLIREPNAELRFADWRDDNFVVSRANSQGFLDREPVSAERAAAGCHIAFIGDSFVEAMEVPIADKFHVRLEEMAARELPHLNITAQAYGIRGTGQINQLPFYDEYARRLNPKVVTLVFYGNDFSDNSTALHALGKGADPDRLPHMSAQMDASGAMKLRPPDPEYKRFLLPRLPKGLAGQAWDRLVRISYFAKWMDKNKKKWPHKHRQLRAWRDMLAERPCCASLTNVYEDTQFKVESLPPSLEEALAYTAFGIEQFKHRADSDGAALAVLYASAHMAKLDDPEFDRLIDRLSAIVEARGIPVISDYDYNVRHRRDPWDGILRHDGHWNATGHQWAAEAVLEWLNANQDVCD